MLRITKSKNAGGAAKYFDEGLKHGDYYATKEHSNGRWGGIAAKRLALQGEVEKERFVTLCNNQKPDGSKLNPRHSQSRKVGWDFTFSVPKSVSLAYAITGDERIRELFEEAVEETMKDIERNAHTLVGQGKNKKTMSTGEMVWAGFTHKTSRPIDGVPDPHLHRHVFVMNTTWNKSKDRFQAMELSPIKDIAPLYEASFHARIAHKLTELGYNITHTTDKKGRNGWAIAGIHSHNTLKKFSRRTSLIETVATQQAAANGYISPEQKAQLGAITREKKQVGLSYQALREVWMSRLDNEEMNALITAHWQSSTGKKEHEITAHTALERACKHLFERKSAVKEYQLKVEALKRGYGVILPEQIDHAIAEGSFHRKQIGNNLYITTQDAIREEHKLLSYVRQGKGSQTAIHPHYTPKNTILNVEQKAAVKHALCDTNNVMIIAGGAGTGKTTLMKEVAAGIEEAGVKLFGFAPSAAASRGVLREEGFDNADTLAQLLHNPKLQEQVKGGVIWVDEAGLIGTKDMNRLFAIAKEQKARLLLTGDVRQHSSVAAGDALRILEEDGGISIARIHAIQRQRNYRNYKMAVNMAAEGNVDAALLKLDKMGNIVEIEEGRHRLMMLVTDYAVAMRKKKSCLIVSPTHIEGKNVTNSLRQKLQLEGLLEEKERSFLQLKNTNWTEENKADSNHYQQTELTVEFHQNAKGHVKGERWDIETDNKIKHLLKGTNSMNDRAMIDLAYANRFTVYKRDILLLAKGDRIRITKGGKTKEGTRINNGDIFTVTGFTRTGDIKLNTGKTLDKRFGHVTHGYVTTSHSSQGKTVDEVFIAQSSQSLPASNQQQFYVSISRGRERCRIYTDDKKALEQAVMQDGKRMTARDIAELDRIQNKRIMREIPKIPQPKKHPFYGTGQSL